MSGATAAVEVTDADSAGGTRARSDLTVRAMSAVVMAAVALAALWLGGVVWTLFVAALAVVMLVEWLGLVRGTAARLAGIVYVALPTAGLVLLRTGHAFGFALTLWTLLVVMATDIGAYFAGRAVGGAKLAPRISPNKTWAGLLGGVVAAALAGAAMQRAAPLPPMLLWLGAPMALLAQGGDLFESWLKRRAGVKDSGTLIPGHGGVLDRLDGLVPVAALVGGLAAAGAI